MRLSWLFGSSMAAHHLLWTYLSVWLIQGGYVIWIALQLKQARTVSRRMDTLAGRSDQDA